MSTTVATAGTITNFTVATLIPDLSGASPNRKVLLRNTYVTFPPFNLSGTTTAASQELLVQLVYYNQVNSLALTMTRPYALSNTNRTTIRFLLPRDVSQSVGSNSASNIIGIKTFNAAGGGSLSFNLYPLVRTIWDLADDDLI
jgi:hypothetical protein